MWTRLAAGAPWLLTPAGAASAWAQPAALRSGATFAVALAAILLLHEFGHWVVCRLYGVTATLPFFLPAPVGIGTFGAFIRIKSPIGTRAALFDIGIAGPLAGLAASLPILWAGLARCGSPIQAIAAPPGMYVASGGLVGVTAEGMHLLFGSPLLLRVVTRWSHPELGPGSLLELHPFVLAAWLGLFATAINLLPLGQLDGGHVLAAMTGGRLRWVALPLLLVIAALGFRFPGWWVWGVIVLILGLRHPPVPDDPLTTPRMALGVIAFIVLAITFSPVPVRVL